MNPERHLWTHVAAAFPPLLPSPPWHLSALEPSAIRSEFCMSHSGLLHSDDPISSTSRKPAATATLKMGLQSSCTSSKPTIRVCVARGKYNTFHVCVVPLKPICPGLFLCSSAEQCCEKAWKNNCVSDTDTEPTQQFFILNLALKTHRWFSTGGCTLAAPAAIWRICTVFCGWVGWLSTSHLQRQSERRTRRIIQDN